MGGDSRAPLPAFQEPVAETAKKRAEEAPVQQGERMIPSATETSRGGARRSPAREECRTTSTMRQHQMSGGFPADRFVGYSETVSGKRQPLATPQPQEPTLVKFRFPSTMLQPRPNANVTHAWGGHCKASTRTEVTAQKSGAFWSSGVNGQDHMVGHTDCRGIDAEDWLDVAHSMLAFGRSEFDS